MMHYTTKKMWSLSGRSSDASTPQRGRMSKEEGIVPVIPIPITQPTAATPLPPRSKLPGGWGGVGRSSDVLEKNMNTKALAEVLAKALAIALDEAPMRWQVSWPRPCPGPWPRPVLERFDKNICHVYEITHKDSPTFRQTSGATAICWDTLVLGFCKLTILVFVS